MTNEQKVGLFFLVGIIIAFAALEATVGSGLLQRGYHLWVEYPTVGGLADGDAVQVAGIKMGSVTQVEIAGDRVRVQMRLDSKAQIRRDSVARLDFQALSGSRFINISLGSPNQPILKDGDTVQGELPPGLTDMVDQLDGVARSVKDLADSLNRNQQELLTNLNSMIEENRSALNATLTNVESITAKLDHGNGTMAKLLSDPELYDRANAMIANLQKVSDNLARGQGTLGRLMTDDDLYDDVRETVVSLNTTARNLETISADVRNGQGTLGRLVTDDSLYQEAQNAVHGLDRATTAIEDQSPISVLGTLVSTLF
jgi:phospholipid/cholesterol/gamma-HCH transport system substrate-binding protein